MQTIITKFKSFAWVAALRLHLVHATGLIRQNDDIVRPFEIRRVNERNNEGDGVGAMEELGDGTSIIIRSV